MGRNGLLFHGHCDLVCFENSCNLHNRGWHTYVVLCGSCVEEKRKQRKTHFKRKKGCVEGWGGKGCWEMDRWVSQRDLGLITRQFQSVRKGKEIVGSSLLVKKKGVCSSLNQGAEQGKRARAACSEHKTQCLYFNCEPLGQGVCFYHRRPDLSIQHRPTSFCSAQGERGWKRKKGEGMCSNHWAQVELRVSDPTHQS